MRMTSSMEDYLEAVFMLQQKNGYARCVDVAEYLGVTKPSVSRAVKELSKNKYLLKRRMEHSPSQNKVCGLRNRFMKSIAFSQNDLSQLV